MARHIFKRIDGKVQYQRRVPARYAELDQRKIIKFSLGANDELEAFRRARRHDEMVEALWRELARGDRPHSDIWDQYRAAPGRARLLGFQ